MSEAQADVKGTKLFFTQREQSEDVHKVLVSPEVMFMKVDNYKYLLCRNETGTHRLGRTHTLIDTMYLRTFSLPEVR